MAEYEAGESSGIDAGSVEGADPDNDKRHDVGLNYSFSFQAITEPVRTVPLFARTIP